MKKESFHKEIDGLFLESGSFICAYEKALVTVIMGRTYKNYLKDKSSSIPSEAWFLCNRQHRLFFCVCVNVRFCTHLTLLQYQNSADKNTNRLRDVDCKILLIFPDQICECYILKLLLQSTPNWLCSSFLLRMTALGFGDCTRPHDKISRLAKKPQKTSNDLF